MTELLSNSLSQLPEDEADPFCVFTPDFIQASSSFHSFAEMIDESPWKIRKGSIVRDRREEITVEEMEEFIQENTKYNNWNDFLDEAIQAWDSDISPEERAVDRRKCHIHPITVETHEDAMKGTLNDLSTRGAGIEVEGLLRAGQWVEIIIPKKKTNSQSNAILRGLVRWSSPDQNLSQAGVELTSGYNLS